jgi:hypothetical protein
MSIEHRFSILGTFEVAQVAIDLKQHALPSVAYCLTWMPTATHNCTLIVIYGFT